MAKVKLLIEAGVDFPSAVKASLGTSIRDFAENRGIPETTVSGVINGSTPWKNEPTRDALAEHLEVERSWIDEQVERQRRVALGMETVDEVA